MNDDTDMYVDVEQFESTQDALAAVEHAASSYDEVARAALVGRKGLSIEALFLMSAVTRARGFHEGCAHGIAAGNHPVVLTVLRSWAELCALLVHVLDAPDYIERLTASREELGRRGTRGPRKSPKALVDGAAQRLPGLPRVYDELSESLHFGHLAMWQAHRIENEDERLTTWTSYPRWRDDRHQLVACAQVLELAEATRVLLAEFVEAHLPHDA